MSPSSSRRVAAARSHVGSMNNRFEPAGSGRLAKQAYQHLRREILRRKLEAGAILTEGSIAESLGMSKTPVRQALYALLQEGLLEAGPRRQMVVRNLSPVQRAELVAVREALERVAVIHACQNMNDTISIICER